MTRVRWVTVLLVTLVAGCADAGAPTTPTTPAGAGPEGGVQVQRRAFAAGGGSGIVASGRHPGVFWAIRDRGGQDRPGRPGNALYAFKVVGGTVGEVAGGAAFKAVPLPVPARDREDIGRDRQGNLWIADIGDNECDRTDTALLKVREPDPAAAGPARLLATYRYRFPDPPPGCAGRNAEAMFLVDDGVLAGGVANLSGADLSADRRRLAVDSHTMLYVNAAADPSPDGQELVADLISRPPAWTVRLAGPGPGPTNVEGVAFTAGGHDLNLLAENRDVFFVPAGAYER